MISNIKQFRRNTADERLLEYLRREIKTFGHDAALAEIMELLDTAQLKLALWHTHGAAHGNLTTADRSVDPFEVS